LVGGESNTNPSSFAFPGFTFFGSPFFIRLAVFLGSRTEVECISIPESVSENFVWRWGTVVEEDVIDEFFERKWPILGLVEELPDAP
jgi:hypothetical protein